MNPANLGNRLVLISGIAPPSKKPAFQKATRQQPATRRIVVVKNGQLAGRAGR
jgi:hypothetical protein